MDRKNSYTNNTIPNMYFTMHRQIVEALEFAKTETIWGKWRSLLASILPIWPTIWPFLQFSSSLKHRYALQSTLFALCHLYNHFYCPFMDLQHSKWQIALKIEDFVFLTSIFPKIWPFLQIPEPLRSIYAL